VSSGSDSGREGKTLGHMPREISKVAWFILRYKGTDSKITRWLWSAVPGRGFEVPPFTGKPTTLMLNKLL